MYDATLPPLKQFAFLPDFPDHLAELEELAEPEDWEYRFTDSDFPRPILYSYIIHTFNRIEEEGKVVTTDDGTGACFDTGLVTEHQEPIYAIFGDNKIPDRQPWYFQGFVRKGDTRMNRFPTLPDIATYFEDPTDVVFDPRMEVRKNIEHIIAENRERLPEEFDGMGDFQLQTLLTGGFENALARVRRNYRIAVPQYHRGRIQLLLPLCLRQPSEADLAAVVERREGYYRVATCLTLDQAYSNARLIGRLDDNWLRN
ncbi:DUF3825 domain-containing protein [Lujinxingia vulgaris]|uniref:DUF3825 domain-containing protein n=1 Tax=Lujinxingia vulgaris TaxID=2600176 RepID=A0A5C6XJH8_9DELT|nr:DUF3825 domain-containing protein [Lujinxingia vulgaris]TXD37769.1 DUF3825 domain-containing protein [Lujinxingia vulgaris]